MTENEEYFQTNARNLYGSSLHEIKFDSANRFLTQTFLAGCCHQVCCSGRTELLPLWVFSTVVLELSVPFSETKLLSKVCRKGGKNVKNDGELWEEGCLNLGLGQRT